MIYTYKAKIFFGRKGRACPGSDLKCLELSKQEQDVYYLFELI